MDSAAWDERYAGSDLVWGAGPNQFVAGEVGELAPGRALDLAAGEGRNAIWLATRGWRVTAVDFSAVGLARGRRLADERSAEAAARITWTVADLRDHAPEPLAFDLLLAAYLQLPAAERTPVLRAAARAVAPGGRLVVVAHDSSNLTEGAGGPRYPEVLYTAGDVVADVAGTGLTVVRAGRMFRDVEGHLGTEARAAGGTVTARAIDALAVLERPGTPAG